MQPPILVPDTQTPIIRRNSSGNFVDEEGHFVDLTKYGVDVSGVTSVAETQLDIDDDTLDGIPSAQPEASSRYVPTQATVGSTLQSELTQITETPQEVPAGDRNDSVIEISSGESNTKKRKLMSKEIESDFFEDHLLELLDAGTLTNDYISSVTIKFIYLSQTVFNMITLLNMSLNTFINRNNYSVSEST